MSDKILTKELAEKFLRDSERVELPEFTSMEDATAESVSKHQGILKLDGITKLTDASAESLSKHQGLLWLGGVSKLSNS